MATPPLPPGFVLEPAAAPAAAPRAVPPPPPGFELEDIPTLGTVQALPPDFSEVTSSVDSTADGRQADGWKAGIPRDLAFGARSVLQGIGSLLGAVGGDALGALETKITGRPVASFRDNAATLGDTLGLPKAQTSGDRVLGDIGEALTGTGLTLGAGGALGASRAVAPTLARAAPAPQLAPTLGEKAAEVLTAQPILQTVSAATGAGASSMARESGAGALGQAAAGVLGGLAPASVTAGAPMAIRGALRGGESNRQSLEDAIKDFGTLGGATPTVGQGTGSRVRQGMENLLGSSPTAGGVMARAGEKQGDQIGKGLNDLARSMSSNPTAEGAGRSIRAGVDTFAKNTKAMRRGLYWQVDQRIPSDAPVELSRTQQALAAMTAPTPGAEATTGALINPELGRIAENLATDLAAGNGKALPYEAVKGLRTRLGEEAFGFSLTPDKPTAQLQQLYHALSNDIAVAAKNAGPDAERALKRANTYYSKSQDRLKLLESVVDQNGGPERIFQSAMSGTREGATVLRSVMRSLPEDAQKDVTAAVIRRMGLANPSGQDRGSEVFSAATFLTNWNKISPEARAALFNRYGGKVSDDIDKLARVAESIKDGSGVLRNPSGTAAQVASFGYGGGLAMSILTGDLPNLAKLVAGGALANLTARAMTSPKTVNWLARNTETPIAALPAQINVLKRIAAENNDEAAADLAAALEGSEEE
ncbi:hypothetical protein [Stenotrophomonas maltophilia]|uniref:hypothetical protein n=1 Tax=Stenotrophomonas maltophilia TaxID=40324 RepID=UPI0011B47103|nr:hypothetical protein [Stenotrophomonas maltophilia]